MLELTTIVMVIVKKIKNRENSYFKLNLITWIDNHYLDFDMFPSNLFCVCNF